MNDTAFEGPESIVVDVVRVIGGTVNGTQRVTATIVDDDSAPSVTLALAPLSIAENGGAATVAAKLSNPSTQPVTVQLGFAAVRRSIATIYAAAPRSPFPRSNERFDHPDGLNDATFEGDESVVIDVTSVTGGTENGTQQVTATITDDESAPSLTLALAPSSMVENSGAATVTAKSPTRRPNRSPCSSGFTGSATFNSDYSASGVSITIPAGQTSGSITLTG